MDSGKSDEAGPAIAVPSSIAHGSEYPLQHVALVDASAADEPSEGRARVNFGDSIDNEGKTRR